MSKVILTVGISGSGKSHWAKQFVAENAGWVIVERDQLRLMMGFPPVGSNDQENLITKMQRGLIETALLDGNSVIVSDTNLNRSIREGLVKYIHKLGYDVEFSVFDTDLDTCIARDSSRDRPVGEIVIRKQFARFAGLKASKFVALKDAPVERYEPYVHAESGKDHVIVADLDGTVAEGNRRSPYDYSNVIDDDPIVDVLEVLKSLANEHRIIFVSGRTDGCFDQTAAWLRKHYGPTFDLIMRKAGDERPDYIIKNEIYDEYIIPNYNIRMVFDDRNQVITHLRARGITVAQVAQGRF